MKAIYKAAIQLAHPYGYIRLIAIRTGMRRGEVGALKWSYITSETFTLPPALTRITAGTCCRTSSARSSRKDGGCSALGH